ncbi:hypothetical protein [Parerythrobacter aestuarii]|nr:hypothetical protein [Parerythrobacter aestuarii]
MRLIKSDLSQNFAIGFAIGALMVAVQIAPLELSSLPQALAAIVAG